MTEPARATAESAAPDGSETVAGLASMLRIATMRLARRLRAERSDETLGLSQLSALATLERFGPLSPTALAEHERIQPPSMTRVIAALESRELIARDAHPSDRRQSVIAITDAGRHIVVEDRRRRQAWLALMIEGLEEDERAQLRSALPLLQRFSAS
ncbi:MAG TPA: MarR family transcriptional regulator [Acidimicrobiales bacterium]|nr:MarR family transcriptional regulator [Acidimicrobiales bacterium]